MPLKPPGEPANPYSTAILSQVRPGLVASINALAAQYGPWDVAVTAAELSNPGGLLGFLTAAKGDPTA